MNGKTELQTNFNFFSIPMVEMLPKEILSLCNFSFLKIVLNDPANKVQIYFLERYAFIARKKTLFISFTSLSEWNEPKLHL
jgi:hypothetical protein